MLRFKKSNGSNYPKWSSIRLSEKYPFIRNGFVGTVTKDFSDKNNGVRYIEGTNIHNGIISDNVEVYVTKDFHQKHIKNELKATDILMVQSGHVGDCAVVGDKYKGSNCHALIIMSNGGDACSEFFVYYFLSEKGKRALHTITTGNTVKHILASDMNKFALLVPCLEEQQKIADCLSSVDAVISDYEAQVENMQNQKKGVMQKLFSQEVRFKANDGSEYPEWKYERIGELYSPIKGAPLSKADISEEGTPFVLYGELYTTYGEVATEIVRKTDKVVDEKYYSEGDDVIIPTSGETPEDISTSTCVVPKGVILAGDLNIYRNKEINGKYFSYVVNHAIKSDIAKIAQGASVIHIKAENVGKIKMPIPCREEQDKIVDCLTSFNDAIEDLQKTVEHWKNIKKGLLQQLFA